MEYFFSKFVLETTDALGMKDVAAIRGARTVPDDAASPKAFDRVAEFIDGRQIDHVEFLHRRRGDFGARELRGAILYDTSRPSQSRVSTCSMHCLDTREAAHCCRS